MIPFIVTILSMPSHLLKKQNTVYKVLTQQWDGDHGHIRCALGWLRVYTLPQYVMNMFQQLVGRHAVLQEWTLPAKCDVVVFPGKS